MSVILAVANRKGGTGKTTTVLHLAHGLVQAGKRVLMVDNDSQANLTEFYGYNTDELEDQKKTIYSMYVEEAPLSALLLRENPALIPASEQLSEAEPKLFLNNDVNRSTLLKDALVELREQYDFILIDCPPWLSLFTANALVAADLLLIPMATKRYGANGVRRLLKNVTAIRRKLNRELEVFGVLPTMYDPHVTNDRRNLDNIHAFAREHGIAVFAPINRRTLFNTELESDTPIDAAAPAVEGILLYQPLVEEVLKYGSK